MWAGELFKAITKNDSTEEKRLYQYLPMSTQHSLQSIKSVYKKRKKEGITPFIVAILHDDIALCEQLIEEGIDFCQRGSAVSHDEFQPVRLSNNAAELLSIGPNSNVFMDFNMTTPMFWAIKCGELGLIDKLVQAGHKMRSLVERGAGMPALSFAILNQSLPVVQHFLLKHSQSCDIHEKSLPDMKPLDLAIRSDNSDMVKFVLENGESLNCTNHQLTPLLLAVFLNKKQIVTLMLSMGADINFGVETGNVFQPLNMAVLRGNYEMAHFLIKNGADVKVKDSTGNTALHLLLPMIKAQRMMGFYQGLPACILAQSLLDKGARVDVANKKGEIPLLQVITWFDPELVDLFLSNPVDLNALLDLKPKATFLHIAVSPPIMFGVRGLVDLDSKYYWKKRCSIVESLIKKGADVNIQSGDGRTALHFAAECGNAELVKMVLASKVDLNKTTTNGKVALHFAAYNGSFEVVKLLLEAGAKVNVKDKVGSTPLDYGIMENEQFSCTTTKLLIDYGADVKSKCVFNAIRVYDVVLAMLRTDLMKLFWRERYPYDLTMFQPAKDFRVSNVKAFFKKFGPNNILSGDFMKRFNPRKVKEIEELMKAQSEFINGVEKNNVDLILKSIQKGAEVKGSSVDMPFPLHFLAKKGFTDAAEVLLSKGVPSNTVDSEGKIAAELAVEFGHFKMYQTLLQYGAFYNRSGFDTSLFKKEGNSEHYKLYLLINKAFKSVRQCDHSILEDLNRYAKLKEWDVYNALINCVDQGGRTLLMVAEDNDFAFKLMETIMNCKRLKLGISQLN